MRECDGGNGTQLSSIAPRLALATFAVNGRSSRREVLSVMVIFRQLGNLTDRPEESNTQTSYRNRRNESSSIHGPLSDESDILKPSPKSVKSVKSEPWVSCIIDTSPFPLRWFHRSCSRCDRIGRHACERCSKQLCGRRRQSSTLHKQRSRFDSLCCLQ